MGSTSLINVFLLLDDVSVIPGMGPEDKVEMNYQNQDDGMIPGLDMDTAEDKTKAVIKKVKHYCLFS